MQMIRLLCFLFCNFFSLVVPLMAQVPPFAESTVFGGSKLFIEEFIPSMSAKISPSRKYFAIGFAQGDQGAGKFISGLDDFASGDFQKVNNAVIKLGDAPWGLRSSSYGLSIHERGTTISITRQEMTSLWAYAWFDNETVNFDVRRSVTDKVSISSVGSSKSGAFFYGGTLRIERWNYGNEFKLLRSYPDSNSFAYNNLDSLADAYGEPWEIANINQAKSLLDYDDTPNKNITYALDLFAGLEIAGSLRLAIHSDRLTTRYLGDIEEKPQFRGGAQIDLGSFAQLSLEADLNEAMRVPFPHLRKSESVSLKIKANALITFTIGAERVTLNGHETTRAGLNAWITGKKHRMGMGFQFGQDTTPWGATWRSL